MRRMQRDGEWADWIVVWVMANMLATEIAIVSSTGSDGLRIVSPAHNAVSTSANPVMILLGHEAEVHYYSLDVDEKDDSPTTSTVETNSSDVRMVMGKKYGEGKITEEICPKCNKKYLSYSCGVHEIGASLVCYSDDQEMCEKCQYEEWHPE